MDDDYLYIFLHTPKSAGSTFIYHLEKNFDKKHVLRIGYRDLGIDDDKRSDQVSYEINIKFLESLSKTRIENLKVIYGHCVHYGIHKYLGRKARYFTFVREPVDRTVSFYNFLRTLYSKEDKFGKLQNFYKHQLLIDGHAPEFSEWVEKKYGYYETALETMHQIYQAYGYLDKNLEAESIRNLMNKFFFVGITENFYRDSAYLFGLLGVDKFFMDVNKSERFVSKIDKKTLKNIKTKNEIDLSIYEAAKRHNQDFVKHHPEYQIFNKNVTKKGLLKPYYQIRYDPISVLRKISSKTRKKSIIYSIILDKIKGIER